MRARLLAFLVACLGLACVGPAKNGIWLDVPYVRQPQNGCGAACIVMVMRYWVRKDPQFHCRVPAIEALQRTLYRPRARGIFASDMVDYLRRKGFRVFAFRGAWSDLSEHLAKGRPLIVCLRQGGLDRSRHYVVVVGLDPARGLVLVNDPARRKLAMVARATFSRQWSAAQNWTLLAVPASNN